MTADELEIIAKTVRQQTLIQVRKEADAQIAAGLSDGKDTDLLREFHVWLTIQAERA